MGIFDSLFGKKKTDEKGSKKQPKEQFERYSGKGICDVCSGNIDEGEGFLVPKDVFYQSKKYREWLANGPLAPMIEIVGGVDAFISAAKAMDSTQYSAVCSKCIHLFKKN
jgi:hypothetical protein